MSPPGQHAQRIERYVQTVDRRALCVRARLTYILPKTFDVYLRRDVASKMNRLPNSRSTPQTPHEKVHHTRQPANPESFIPFGTVCFVPQSLGKRTAVAHTMGANYGPKDTPPAELEVCLGTDMLTPTCHIFVLRNGLIVPRNTHTARTHMIRTIPFD